MKLYHCQESPETDSEHVVLWSEDFDRVDHYGDECWVVDENECDIKASDILDEIIGKLLDDYMSPYRNDDVMQESFADEIDPPNIVSTAGVWDDIEFVSWFAGAFPDYHLIRTWDGAVLIHWDYAENYKIEKLQQKEV